MSCLKKISSIAATLIFSISLPLHARQSVEWLEGQHDFGAFDEDDGNVSCNFRFVNTGDEPISIIAARPSCGCTVPSFQRTPVAPGDTAAISVTFNPTGRPGRFDKNVKVQLSGGDPARITLKIKGVVIGNSNTLRSRYPVDAPPLKLRTSVIAFPEFHTRHSKAEFVEVYNASSDSVTPQWVDLPSYIKVTTVRPTVPPGEQIAYAVTLSPGPSTPYGLLTDSITLIPAPGAKPVTLDIVTTINEDFSNLTEAQRRDAPRVKPSTDSVDFGSFSDLSASNIQSRTFKIYNEGKNPLKIRRIYTNDPGVSVSVDQQTVKKGKSATATITVDPSLLPSDILNARIALITNDPDNSTIIIRAVGY